MSVNEQLLNIWQEAWRPPDRQPVWQWAEEHIRSIPYSPMPGRFRIANSRMLQEVMDAIVDPHVRLVSIVAVIRIDVSEYTAKKRPIPEKTEVRMYGRQ